MVIFWLLIFFMEFYKELKWSFSYDFFVKISIYPTIHLQHGPFLMDSKDSIINGLCCISDIKLRAYPGSEFVVANTVAKWEKLEPNEINFS